MIKRFNRFELKYLVTGAQRDALREEIRERMAVDPEASAGGRYQVTSLYFDTSDHAFFRSKLDGIKFRRKLRIRVYGDVEAEPDPLAMVEIKQRINRTVQKRRVAIPLSDAYFLGAGGAAEELALDEPRDRVVAQEIEFLVRSLTLSPACVVSYTREAYMGREYEPGLRVTFDQSLWCAGPDRGVRAKKGPHFLDPDRIVLEVKANEAVPSWVVRMLTRHGITIQRYSKYCAALAHLRAHPARSLHG